MKISKTKEEIVAQVSKNTRAIKSLDYKIEDINALWHWCKCLNNENNKMKKEIQQLHEEINNIITKREK